MSAVIFTSANFEKRWSVNEAFYFNAKREIFKRLNLDEKYQNLKKIYTETDSEFITSFELEGLNNEEFKLFWEAATKAKEWQKEQLKINNVAWYEGNENKISEYIIAFDELVQLLEEEAKERKLI